MAIPIQFVTTEQERREMERLLIEVVATNDPELARQYNAKAAALNARIDALASQHSPLSHN